MTPTEEIKLLKEKLSDLTTKHEELVGEKIIELDTKFDTFVNFSVNLTNELLEIKYLLKGNKNDDTDYMGVIPEMRQMQETIKSFLEIKNIGTFLFKLIIKLGALATFILGVILTIKHLRLK